MGASLGVCDETVGACTCMFSLFMQSRRPVHIPVDSNMFDMERDVEDGSTEYGSGYSGYSGYSGVSSGSGSGYGSGEEEKEEDGVDACLVDPFGEIS